MREPVDDTSGVGPSVNVVPQCNRQRIGDRVFGKISFDEISDLVKQVGAAMDIANHIESDIICK
ncbi:hypothetical protein MTX20_00140 (plasmid) [Bradyrhizobium sp. ISRA435]|nr:hypothetical protein MTX20_00140 [Bradyrhizobium sp. ISRA435]